jgi:hypothetical protein
MGKEHTTRGRAGNYVLLELPHCGQRSQAMKIVASPVTPRQNRYTLRFQEYAHTIVALKKQEI